jgi:hypothetical protein
MSISIERWIDGIDFHTDDYELDHQNEVITINRATFRYLRDRGANITEGQPCTFRIQIYSAMSDSISRKVLVFTLRVK